MVIQNSYHQELASFENHMVDDALQKGHHDVAKECLFQSIKRLQTHLGHKECDHLYVSNTLELSNLCFVMGQSFPEILPTLQTSLSVCKRRGDLRSQALIKLHIGRLYYFSNQRAAAMDSFADGKNMVEELGDKDILIEAGEFLGLYFHMQGMFIKAKEHFERATLSYEMSRNFRSVNPSAAMWMSYCDAYMGQFGHAIGRLAHHRRMALERSENTLATTLLSVLGIILAIRRQMEDSASCLKNALTEASSQNNALALWFARVALAYIQISNGDPEKARSILAGGFDDAKKAGLVRQYASPFVLEMAYELYRCKTAPIVGFNFWDEISRVMNEPNIHLKGVALRLHAADSMNRGEDQTISRKHLEASVDLLARCGDPIQLGLARLQFARLHLAAGDQKKARSTAQKACQDLSAFGDAFYPKDLGHLISRKTYRAFQLQSSDEYLHRFMDIVHELIPTAEPSHLLSKAISSINKLLEAERGAIFLVSKGRKSAFQLRFACNISQDEINSEDFRENMRIVRRAYKENRALTIDMSKRSAKHVKSVLCIPFKVESGPRGVLYHDNSYLAGRFDALDKNLLTRMANYLSTFINSAFEYNRRTENMHRPVIDNISSHSPADVLDKLTKSRRMLSVLDQVDKIAKTDCTVLITGETGVGKELLAQRFHKRSKRRDANFAVVEINTIPGNLIESELFGFEKGAFTGANCQKIGRLEMAHRGTLFLDEIGEIPKFIQTKLLRVLQEKTLVRIGGNRTLTSDFRLIAATNRDLVEEVKSGRFREDLFYRLNVVPIVIPPLRDRKSDILPIASYYLSIYSAKYNRKFYELSPEVKRKVKDYSWPGNVRELKNVIERAILLSEGDQLELAFPLDFRVPKENIIADTPTLDELQRRYIELTLKKTNNKIGGPGGAAEILGVKRSSLYNRLKKFGIR